MVAGRGVLAAQPLLPGVVVLRDTAIAAVAITADDCDRCLRPCDAGVPCRQCTRVMYCRSLCQTRAQVTKKQRRREKKKKKKKEKRKINNKPSDKQAKISKGV